MIKNPAKEIIETIQILIDSAMKKITNVNGGIITSIDENKKYSVNIRGKTNSLPAYPKNANIQVGDSVFVIVPQGENSQGFILPNSFNNLNENMFIVDENINITTTPEDDIYGKGVFINDINNKRVGYIRAISLSTGEDGIELATIKNINGTIYKNSVDLFIDKSGNKSVKISDPDAWKTALQIS